MSERVELNREASSPTYREAASAENSLLLVASDNQATMIQVTKKFLISVDITLSSKMCIFVLGCQLTVLFSKRLRKRFLIEEWG